MFIANLTKAQKDKYSKLTTTYVSLPISFSLKYLSFEFVY
jgi:hypothetical protein